MTEQDFLDSLIPSHKLDEVLDAIWHYEVISRDIHLAPFQTTPLYEAVLQLQEYLISSAHEEWDNDSSINY
jgi:hypothetical protein